MTDILERLAKPAMWLAHEDLLAERADAAAEIEALRDRLAALRDRLAALDGGEAALQVPTHRHRKRGSTYRILFEGVALQTSAGPVPEGRRLVIYQGEDGQRWARAEGEFHDGRFEPLAGPADTGPAD